MSGIQHFLEGTAEAMRLFGRKPKGINGYFGIDDFISKNGRAWLPDRKPRKYRFGPLRECYRNAAILALNHPELIYCEGYAANIFPVLHAWCVTDDGKVVDNTWRKPGGEYFGLAFQLSYLTRTLHETGCYGVIDNWQKGWPLLREKPNHWRHPIMRPGRKP